MDEDKRHLDRLVAEAAKGEALVIGRDGNPIVTAVAFGSAYPGEKRRLGFLAGEISVPDDFDQMGRAVIAAHFEHGTTPPDSR